MTKEVLAVDIDEVLFPFVAEFSFWHNNEYGTDYSLENFHTYDFDKVLGESIPETVHRIHTFLSVEHAHMTVAPLEEAQDAITKLTERYRPVAVTARHPEFENPTLQYLLHHFKEIITDITLVGHKETLSVVRSKAEVCQEVGAIALIDDSITHVANCAAVGIDGILFGNYPWNQAETLPAGVTRYDNWQGVLGHLGIDG